MGREGREGKGRKGKEGEGRGSEGKGREGKGGVGEKGILYKMAFTLERRRGCYGYFFYLKWFGLVFNVFIAQSVARPGGMEIVILGVAGWLYGLCKYTGMGSGMNLAS